MKKIKTIFLLAISISFFIFSCQSPTGTNNEENLDLNPIEDFNTSDSPADYGLESLSFKGPWGYGKTENEARLYPLLVSGYWDEGSSQYSAMDKRFPSFVMSFQKNTVADGQLLGQWIKNAIAAGYRIDINRIYLTGFSMGGSGSFPLARGMYAEGLYFAAIIRVAGQSEPDLGNEIARETALWYHIGLSDNQTRIDIAQSALKYNRAYECNGEAIESSTTDTVSGHERTTVTLTRSGYPMFLYSEYAGMGHESSPCYTDATLFPWLFSHSLKYR